MSYNLTLVKLSLTCSEYISSGLNCLVISPILNIYSYFRQQSISGTFIIITLKLKYFFTLAWNTFSESEVELNYKAYEGFVINIDKINN